MNQLINELGKHMKGLIELGGTKIICAVAEEPGAFLDSAIFQTTTPEKYIKDAHSFFKGYCIDSLGIAAFGPIIVDPSNPNYGHILKTPKPYWSNADILNPLKDITSNIKIDTDVNCACLGEYHFDGFRNDSCLIYITVGTGIGVGIIISGIPMHGKLHPETGHIPLVRHCEDTFIGSCPFHKDCATALASGKSIEERKKVKGENISESDYIWEIEAYYIAQVVYSCVLSYSPDHIVIGGGVMNVPHLIDKIRQKLTQIDDGYIFNESFDCKDFLRTSELNGNQALLGAFSLTMKS